MKTIWKAVELNDVDCLKELLREESENPDSRDETGKTPLLKASAAGYIEIVEILLDAGADIAAIDQNQTTALHFSSWEGHLDVTQLLLARGCSPHLTEGKGWTALHDAVRKENLSMAAEILSFISGKGGIKPEISESELKGLNGDSLILFLLEWMVRLGVPVDSIGICGKSLLDDAVERGYTKSAAYIKEHKS